MAVIKCKMCGGSLNLTEDSSVCECEYCGTRQTVPKADDEKKLTLFGRAGKLLRACEFDKAAGVFESIVSDFPEEAEAYWGLVLCKYGIEYVDDPATGKKIPTCHRSSFESVEDDPNFEQACENADAVARRVYRDEARQIEGLRKRILEVSGKEEPYDVFISYKETDEKGERTPDSVIAQDIYKALTNEGYRVFFSRISLEGKLGVEYEPYIFAALNSAKVLLAVGTDYEYYDAVWVKNEWSRFLKLIASGKQKTLIPVYKDMDPYDMPKELRSLAAQNMGKIGAMQDLLHGIEKILGKKKTETAVQETVIMPSVVASALPLLERAFLFLKDKEWESAAEYCEKALDLDPKNANAYLAKLMAELHISSIDKLAEVNEPLDSNRCYQKALRFADTTLESSLKRYAKQVREQLQNQKDELVRIQKEHEDELACIRKRNAKAKGMISAGRACTAAVTVDGTVLAAGDNATGRCDVSRWSDVIAVATGINETIGLRADGTVISTELKQGQNYGQCHVASWNDLIAISASGLHTVGLRADGTVVSTYYTGDRKDYKGQCDVSSWRDIVEISASVFNTVGLKSDGTVVLAGTKEYGRDGALNWTDIVSISCGADHIVGLKADGTVVAVGSNTCGQSEVSSWTDIVAISAGNFHTVGLRADGTVVSTEYKYSQKPEWNYGQCNVSSWRNIVTVSAGRKQTVGVRADGTVIATVYSGNPKEDYGQCNVYGWRLFNHLDTIDEERKAAAEKTEAERKAAAEMAEAERKARIAALNREKAELQEELADLRGLFTGKRRKEIEARLAEIEAELKTLG